MTSISQKACRVLQLVFVVSAIALLGACAQPALGKAAATARIDAGSVFRALQARPLGILQSLRIEIHSADGLPVFDQTWTAAPDGNTVTINLEPLTPYTLTLTVENQENPDAAPKSWTFTQEITIPDSGSLALDLSLPSLSDWQAFQAAIAELGRLVGWLDGSGPLQDALSAAAGAAPPASSGTSADGLFAWSWTNAGGVVMARIECLADLALGSTGYILKAGSSQVIPGSDAGGGTVDWRFAGGPVNTVAASFSGTGAGSILSGIVNGFDFTGNVDWNTGSNNRIRNLIFSGNGGDGSMQALYLAEGATPTLPAIGFSRTGHAFTGWNSAADGSGTAYADQASVNFGGSDILLYAQWMPVSNSIAFNANGGAGTMSTISKDYGTAVSLPANAFALPGYAFTGWNTAADGSGTAYADQASLTMGSASLVLYAIWSANINSITFDPNGGSGTMADYSLATAASTMLTANAFTLADYQFTGWNTAADGSGTAYADQASFTMGTASVTLYAQWTPNPGSIGVTILFDNPAQPTLSWSASAGPLIMDISLLDISATAGFTKYVWKANGNTLSYNTAAITGLPLSAPTFHLGPNTIQLQVWDGAVPYSAEFTINIE